MEYPAFFASINYVTLCVTHKFFSLQTTYLFPKKWFNNSIYNLELRYMRLTGFEPATYGFEVRCSIQMSYRRILKGYINAP